VTGFLGLSLSSSRSSSRKSEGGESRAELLVWIPYGIDYPLLSLDKTQRRLRIPTPFDGNHSLDGISFLALIASDGNSNSSDSGRRTPIRMRGVRAQVVPAEWPHPRIFLM
jgi:hypothetical protein